jgi:hypothetical protein
MTEIQEIDVIIKPDGTVRMEVRGAKGPKCLNLTENIEQQLGGLVVERTLTDEFDQTEEEQTVRDFVEEKQT